MLKDLDMPSKNFMPMPLWKWMRIFSIHQKFVVPMVEAYLDGADYVIGSRYIKEDRYPKAGKRLGNLFLILATCLSELFLLSPSFMI